MEFNYAELRGRIRARFSTQADFAKALGKSESSVSKKLNGQSEWDAGEIRKACEVLDIPAAEIPTYFFTL